MKSEKYNRRLERCKQANIVITAIASHGRKFFADDDKIAHFLVDKRGFLWFQDEYNEKPQYLHLPRYREWTNFSGGGTMRRLVEALKNYIISGIPIGRGHFGPWDKSLCDGDLWGYGFDEMEKVRAAVMASDAVIKPLPLQVQERKTLSPLAFNAGFQANEAMAAQTHCGGYVTGGEV